MCRRRTSCRGAGTASQESACSYCGATRAADISVLLDELSDVIQAEYTDPANELAYESREGAYQGQIYVGSELVLGLDGWTDNEELLEEAADAFAGSDWCEHDFCALKPYQALSVGWTRFLFLQELDDTEDQDTILPGNMLDALGELFLDFELLSEMLEGTEFVRASIVNTDERASTAAELGTAPRQHAVSPNRMSPAGIPMFYAAVDEETAVLKTCNPTNDGSRETPLARFRTARSLKIVDLTSLPAMPSSFDRENRAKRQQIAFLKPRRVSTPVAGQIATIRVGSYGAGGLIPL